MVNPLRAFRVRPSFGVAVIAAFTPLCLMAFWDTDHRWWAVGAVTLAVALFAITFHGRSAAGWVAATCSWVWRHRRPPAVASEPVVGATVLPGDHVALRWDAGMLVALVSLVPRPFTPTVIVGGKARTDDEIDTRLVERLIAVHCPDLTVDVVSAGFRVGPTTSNAYADMVGSDPAPAYRRTWIVVRADPRRARPAAERRDAGVAGLARYLTASTTRLAERLSSNGVDAVCERSFDDFDHATAIDFVREGWSKIKGVNGFTAAYTAPGGPDAWWSVAAQHTVTRVRIEVGAAPRSTVLLTTAVKPKKPAGFAKVSGGQRAAMRGDVLVPDRHHRMPIGSAGVLVGRTRKAYPVYLPFDDVDSSIDVVDDATLSRFVSHAAAAGGRVTLSPRFRDLAAAVGADVGTEDKVAWSQATTYLGPHAGLERIVLRQDAIGTPRHPRIRIMPESGGRRRRPEPAAHR